MIQLRDYQELGKSAIYNAWASHYRNVLLRFPTGMGKTKTFASLVIEGLNDPRGSVPTVVMVHRKELVQQISLTFAEEGVFHNIIASRKDIRGIISAQRRLYGKSFYNPNSILSVISVDTLISREENYSQWALGIRRWVTDEAAHVLKDNKWGEAIAMFKNAQGLGVTATPERLDRKGLGSHADGVFDVMVEGPDTRWGIDNGYLSDYKIACPPSDYAQYLNSSNDTSDYSKQTMIDASRKSQIVGDVVENYLKFAKDKQAILFADSIETAEKMEKKFVERGITAKSLDSKTADSERLDSLIQFQEKKIKILINVDLFDEGLDVPGIECVIMARPTKSLGKYLQMVGRGLRKAKDKPFMILIDHVGNVKYHGLPCKPRKWTLDRIAKRQAKFNFMRICANPTCNAPYDRANSECPWCGFKIERPAPGSGSVKSMLEQVDGDLELIDPKYLASLEAAAKLEDPGKIADKVGRVAGGPAALRAMKNQQERIETQKQLVEAIAKWAGFMKNRMGYTDRMIHKKFYIHHEQTITEALGEPAEQMRYTMQRLEDVWSYCG